MKSKFAMLIGITLAATASAQSQPNISTLTLNPPAHVVGEKQNEVGLDITKVNVNPQTHVITFSFDQCGPDMRPFQISVKPEGNSPCIHNMKTLAHMVSSQVGCGSAEHCAPGNEVKCSAVTHTLVMNSQIRPFLVQQKGICR